MARRLISGNRGANRAKILQPVPINHAGLLAVAKERVGLPKQPDNTRKCLVISIVRSRPSDQVTAIACSNKNSCGSNAQLIGHHIRLTAS
jgi:hypothetical protein